jgi:HK97 family phage major capsid protein
MDPKTDITAFRKLGAEGQLAALRGHKEQRVFTIERDGAIDEKARTVWLSIASDRPYERWWGVEVLDVKSGAIREERLKSGAPLLVGHDSADQVGVVEKYEITSDRKLRVLARFSRSVRAEEIWRDVLDGIRRNTSVGYIIHDLVLEKQEGDTNTYRVTDWEPLEGSLVAIPADPGVGVGRAIEDATASANQRKTTTMDPKEQEAKDAAAKQAAEKAALDAAATNAKAVEEAVKREQERMSGLIAAGEEFKDLGGPAIAKELLKDPKATQDTFKLRMLDAMRGKSTVTKTGQEHAQPAAFGAGARVRFRYGKLQAFTKDLPLADGTKMPAEEAAYRSGMWLAAAIFNKDWAHKWLRTQGVDLYQQLDNGEVRVMTGNTLAAGGALVPSEMEQAIIDLRDVYGVARRLVRVRPMSSDTKSIPRRKGGLTAYFFNDDDGVGIASSDKNWDMVNLTTKKLGALARIGEDLEEDAIIDVVDDLAQEMAYAFAVKEDQCLIIGDGTSAYGGMQGLIPKFEGTAYLSRITTTSAHDTFPEIDNIDLTTTHGGCAAFAKTGAKWLCSEEFKATVFDRLKATAGGNTIQSLGGATQDSYLGYAIETSQVMPTDPAADLTNKVMALFGRFDLAASLGNRRGITTQVLRERYAELGQIGIKATERFDIVVHDLGSTSVKGPVAAMYGNT